MKKKIAFMAPETKWWPYYIYKDIVKGLKEKYNDKLEVYFFNSKLDWLKLHFKKYDFIISVVPFLFKPLWAKNYIFNPRWNFEIEKKRKSLWNKLLYLARNNLRFADKIMLTSYFLADKLNFRKQYENKIVIIPNFIDEKEYDFWEKKYNNDVYNILTITSFKFYDKWKGILDLWNVVYKLWNKTDKKINWTIVWNDEKNENFQKIKKEFDKIGFWENVNIIWRWWLWKEEIKNELKKNDYFIYWTYLDNFPNILLEAIVSNMKVLVNNFESFPYFIDSKIICKTENDMVEKILNDDIKKINIDEYKRDKVLNKLYNKILCAE